MTAHTLITLYGVVAVSFMMTMYAVERTHPLFILAFAAGCLASAAYGFLSGAWPFGVVEAIWSVIAVRRYYSPEQPAEAALTREERADGPGGSARTGTSVCGGAPQDRCLGLCRQTMRLCRRTGTWAVITARCCGGRTANW